MEQPKLPPAFLSTAKVRGCESEVAAQLALEGYGLQCYAAGVAAERERFAAAMLAWPFGLPIDYEDIEAAVAAIRKGETP